MVKLVLALSFVLGCNTDDGGTAQMMLVDAPPGTPMCTKALYDPCTTNDQCASGNCHFFEQSNFTVCTQACSGSTACPADSSGAAGQCNNRGICKPAAANVCVP